MFLQIPHILTTLHTSLQITHDYLLIRTEFPSSFSTITVLQLNYHPCQNHRPCPRNCVKLWLCVRRGEEGELGLLSNASDRHVFFFFSSLSARGLKLCSRWAVAIRYVYVMLRAYKYIFLQTVSVFCITYSLGCRLLVSADLDVCASQIFVFFSLTFAAFPLQCNSSAQDFLVHQIVG